MATLSTIKIEIHELIFVPGESRLPLTYTQSYSSTPNIVASCGNTSFNVYVEDVQMLIATIALSGAAEIMTKVQIQIMGT